MTVRYNALAAIAALCLPFAASAQDGREPVTARVAVADLDLASPAGIAALNARIRLVAANACASTLPGLAGSADAARCRREMEVSATQQTAALVRRAATVRVAAR